MDIEKLKKTLKTWPLNPYQKKGVDGKYHTLYLIFFENGFYYVGKHSTDNLNDRYFASGKLPKRYRDFGYLYIREIISYENSDECALFLETSILSNSIIYDNELCLNCYPGSPPSAQGTIVIKQGNRFKMCNPKLLDYYLENGWVVGAPKRVAMTNFSEDVTVLESQVDEYLENGYVFGRSKVRGRVFINKDNVYKFILKTSLPEYLNNGWVVKHPHSGRVVLARENNVVKINDSELDEYLAKGYSKTSTVDGLKYIRKNGKFKRVHLDELPTYLNNGWELGTNINQTVYMNNGINEIRVNNNEIHIREKEGFIKGRIKFVYLNNDIIERRLNPNELEKINTLIENGFKIGKIVRTKKRKVIRFGEIRYILEGSLPSYLKNGWEIIH